MPFKKTKNDAADALVLEWVLQVKNYKLTLDRDRCVGCQICTLACPKQAISLQKQPSSSETTKHAKVDIDLEKCNFCGICQITCPYSALKVTLNGGNDLAVLAKESYPQLIKDIVVDTRKCDKDCVQCEAVCPLKLIKIQKVGFDGKPVGDLSALSPLGKKRVQVNVDIQKQYCPTCRACEFKCSPGAITVKKVIEGNICINQEKCPEGCHACVDVCPITGTLLLGENGKVAVNQQTCMSCGACKNVCPQPEALVVNRTKVNHTPIHSGTWNKTLERLTSPENAIKEFKAQAAHTRRELVAHRFEVEEMKKNERSKSY
jgi:4Fe-4S ferredoxin